jgi:uncharacterized SAM-binding protein YcdF (DUF218 family)
LPEHEVVAAVLESQGVPPDAIVKVGQAATSTFDDFQGVAQWAEKTNAKRIVIPADLFHTRRVAWTADHVLGPAGVESQILAFSPPLYSLTNWWTTERGLIDFNNELLKYAFYRFKY